MRKVLLGLVGTAAVATVFTAPAHATYKPICTTASLPPYTVSTPLITVTTGGSKTVCV